MDSDGVGVTARGLGVRGRRGPVFEGVDLDVPPGGLLVVHGPAGSGRTSLLLALAGRMRIAAGAVLVGPHRLPGRDAAAVRASVAVARAEPAVALEGRLRVGELVAERGWLSRRATLRRVARALRLTGIAPDPHSPVEDLPPVEQALFAVSLALAQAPAALVVDDLTRGCPSEEHDRLWRALDRVRATGPTVLASATEAPPTHDCTTVALPRFSTDLLPAPPGRATGPGSAAGREGGRR